LTPIERDNRAKDGLGVSAGIDAGNVLEHLEILADRVGVSTKALWLWFFRMCVDFYHSVVEGESPAESGYHNNLERVVRTLGYQCKSRATGTERRDVLKALMWISCLPKVIQRQEMVKDEYGRDLYPQTKITPASLPYEKKEQVMVEMLKRLQERIPLSAEMWSNMLMYAERHWVTLNHPADHPYLGLAQIDYHSLARTMHECYNLSQSAEAQMLQTVHEKLGKALTTTSGRSIGGKYQHIRPDMGVIAGSLHRLMGCSLRPVNAVPYGEFNMVSAYLFTMQSTVGHEAFFEALRTDHGHIHEVVASMG
jgi:hypothetical protein